MSETNLDVTNPHRRGATKAILLVEEAIELIEQGDGIPYPFVYDLRDKLKEVRYENGEHPVFRCVRSACSQLRDDDHDRTQKNETPLFTPKEHELLIWYYSIDGDEMMDDHFMRSLDINEEDFHGLTRRYRQEVAKVLGIRKSYADVFMGLLKITV